MSVVDEQYAGDAGGVSEATGAGELKMFFAGMTRSFRSQRVFAIIPGYHLPKIQAGFWFWSAFRSLSRQPLQYFCS